MAVSVLVVFAALVLAAALTPTTHWVQGTGHVMTENEAEIRPSVQGAIDRRLVDSGATVRKGQLLVQLIDSIQQATYEQARDERQAVQARLEHMRSAQLLERRQRSEQIFRAERKLRMATDELKKMEDVGSDVVSVKELAEVRLEVDLAASGLAELKLPRDEVMDKQIRVLEEQVKSAKQDVVLWKSQVELRRIRSPLDGIVQFNRFGPGEVVNTGDVVGQVFDPGSWIVRLKLSERHIAYVREGQRVQVWLTARSPSRRGSLRAAISDVTRVVTPQATGDGIFVAEARIDDPSDPRLKVGLTARARIETGRTKWLFRLLGW